MSFPVLRLALAAALAAAAPDPVAAGQYVHYAPTPPAVADAMLRLASVGPDDVVYDLGSGDGRLVIEAAARYGARGVGVEHDRALVEVSRRNAQDRKMADRVRFIEGDLFAADITDATVVLLYLTPSLNTLLEPKLRRELRPGTRIVSHAFGIGTWVPEATVRADDGTELFLWTVPRRPARAPDVYFAPTAQSVADAMLKLARVGEDDVVFDLGSGDGRIVIMAAQRYGAHGVGIELDPALVEVSRQVAREAGVADKVTFVEGDLLTADISKATVVTLYLSPTLNRALEPRLARELPPGARIVSHQFPLGTWPPDRTVRAADGTDLFLWVVPAR